MKKVLVTLPMAAAAALLTATPAVADVAYMTGLFGAKVNYASIVAPPGQGCDPRGGCQLIPYANFSPSAVSITRGAEAIENFVAAHPGQNTIWTYSDSTDAAIEYVNTHPEDTTTRFYLLGAPSTPGNSNITGTHPTLGSGAHSNVTFVLRQYDIVADVPAGTANFARYNLSQSVHRNGYDNLNLANPAITYTDPRTGSATKYFLTYPLPAINKFFKTPAQIAAEDRTKRPGIESQYYLPGKVQRPVVLPSPTYPATPAAKVTVEDAAATTTADATDQPRGLRKVFASVSERLSERREATRPATATAEKDTSATSPAAKKDRPRLSERVAQRRAQRTSQIGSDAT